MDGFENNNDITEFFEELLKRDILTGAIEGIAKQIVSKGENSMTTRQREVVSSFIKIYESKNHCDRCGNGNVTCLNDFIYIADNGLCSMCDYDREKYMKD